EAGDGDADRPLDHLLQAGQAQAPFLATLDLVRGRDDRRVHERERGDALVARIHDDHALADADLRRRQPDTVLGVHRLEHVRNQRTDLVRHGSDRLRAGAQHGVTEEPHLAHHGQDFGSAAAGSPSLRLILERATTMRVFSPVRIVTRSSARWTMMPMMPPSVTTSSLRWSEPSISRWRCAALRCGRISRNQKISAKAAIWTAIAMPAPPPPGAAWRAIARVGSMGTSSLSPFSGRH